MSSVLRSSFSRHENNGMAAANFLKESHSLNSSTVSHREMNMEANTGVYSRVSGMFSGASSVNLNDVLLTFST